MDTVLISVIAAVAGVVLIACCCTVCVLRRRNNRRKEEALQSWTNAMIQKRDADREGQASVQHTTTRVVEPSSSSHGHRHGRPQTANGPIHSPKNKNKNKKRRQSQGLTEPILTVAPMRTDVLLNSTRSEESDTDGASSPLRGGAGGGVRNLKTSPAGETDTDDRGSSPAKTKTPRGRPPPQDPSDLTEASTGMSPCTCIHLPYIYMIVRCRGAHL